MTFCSKSWSLASAALVGALAVSPARATVIQTAPSTVTFSTLVTDWAGRSGSFALFNTNLGTLISVALTASYSASSHLTVQNTSNANSNGTVRVGSQLILTSSNGSISSVLTSVLNSPIFDNLNNVVGQYTVDAVGGARSYGLAAGATVTGLTSSFSNVQATGTVTDPADLTAFKTVGSAVATLLASTYTTSVLANNGGNTSAVQSTTASGSFTVIYTYDDSTPETPPTTPVPEPASIAMIGIGLIGLARMRRRSRAA